MFTRILLLSAVLTAQAVPASAWQLVYTRAQDGQTGQSVAQVETAVPVIVGAPRR